MRNAGVIHLPGDRHREGVMLSLSVRENMSLLALAKVARSGVVARARERTMVRGQIDTLGVRTPSAETPVASLSGGNQQKVLFARALLGAPDVLLADEPTRGVDAGARIDLYRVLREAAAAGRAVLVLSSDAVELQGLCDRVLVFSRGRVVAELEGEQIGEERITGAAVTSEGGHRDEVTLREERLKRVRRFVSGDYLPSVALAVLIVAFALYTQSSNSRFLSPYNLSSTLLLVSALALVSFGQLVLVMAANLDLSVGPLMGLIVVVSSFFWATGQGAGDLVLGIVLVIATALAVGLVNGLLVRVGRLTPVLATLSMYIVIQGVGLQLRPQEAGFLRADVTGSINKGWSWMPIAFLVVVVIAVVGEVVLRRTRAGLELRAVGSDETRAHRLGARVNRTQLAAYVGCSLSPRRRGSCWPARSASATAIRPRASATPSTASPRSRSAARASSGGRGSFIGTLLGAVLLTEVVSAVPFLHIALSWNQWLPGLIILVAVGAYSRARGGRRRNSRNR